MSTKRIETLVHDIYKLLSSGSFDADVGHSFVARGSQTTGTLRMSSIGTPCDRKLWYKHTDAPKEPLEPWTLVKFGYGDLLEDYVLSLAEAAGHDVERRQEEVEVDGIKGHIDAVIDGVLIDVKSTSKYAFDKFKVGKVEDDDPFGYVAQLNGYKLALGIERAGWLAVNRENGMLCFCEMKVNYPVRARIEHLKSVILSNYPPDRGFDPIPEGKSGNYKLPMQCSYCEYKKMCWPSVRTFIYSNGPVFLTHVEREPNVKEVT